MALFKAAKLSVKLGLAGGAVYVASSQGVFRDGEDGEGALSRLGDTVSPVLNKYLGPYVGPYLPKVPSGVGVCETVKSAWNSGVHTSILALSNLPQRSGEWAGQGWTYVRDLVK
ncbi:MICOS complex subunit MIC13 [Petromyzon marinus]|uniref:MICOS complex subunit MIC13 n=1 Tax=Lethenteron reissneri TaxID=7753 RepID=UPI002AB640A5|nr:MICOS complex subunit MIC13 [Lethenteron reissneri]